MNPFRPVCSLVVLNVRRLLWPVDVRARRRRDGRRWVVAAAIGFVGGSMSLAGGEQMLDDDMHDVGLVWSVVEGDDPSGSSGTEITADAPPYMRLNNSVLRSDLYRSVHGSWILSFKAALSTEQRRLWVGAFNAEGTRGLGVQWDSASNAGPEGRVSLLKYDLDSEIGWSTEGEEISGGFPAGHPVTGGTLADFRLHYDAGTQVLAVSVNDQPLTQVRVQEPAFTDFSRIYVRGNETAFFDDIAFNASRPTPEFMDEMQSLFSWSPVDGSGAVLEPYPGGTRVRLNNGLLMAFVAPVVDEPLVRQQLQRPGNVEDNWTLAFDAAHSTRKRGLWVGIFDQSRTKGYGVLWDSAIGGTGVVSIRKFDLESEVQWEDKGVALTKPVRSGHDPFDTDMARIELSWVKDSRTLYLAVDGVPRAHVVDDSFDSFSHLFIRGNTTSYFDNLALLSETPLVHDEIYNIASDGGAVGDGVTDNRAAILASVAAATAQGRDLYVPPGFFAYSGTLAMQNVRLCGAGYPSVLKALDPDHRSLHFTGSGGRIANLRLLSPTTDRSGDAESAAISLTEASEYVIEAIHIEGSNSVGILSHSDRSSSGRIANNWISGTLADGIHLSSGAENVIVSRNMIQKAGEDGMARSLSAGRPALAPDSMVRRHTIHRDAPRGEVAGQVHPATFIHNVVCDCGSASLQVTLAIRVAETDAAGT